jgi:outer membrane protein TolC
VKPHFAHQCTSVTMHAMVTLACAFLLVDNCAVGQQTTDSGSLAPYIEANPPTDDDGNPSDRGILLDEGLIEQDQIQGSSFQASQALSVLPPPVNNGTSTSLDSVRVRAHELSDDLDSSNQESLAAEAITFDNWWEPQVQTPFGLSNQIIAIDVGGLTQTALIQSPLVRSVLTEPKIRQHDMVIENAAFDSLAFIEGKFAETNDPVGSALITGNNSDRFLDDTLSSAAGLRKRNRTGGTIDLAQRNGFQSNNSTFLIPNPQGTSRLELNYSQPLMRDRGRAVNQTRIVLAQIDLQIANADAHQELQDHLFEVTQAYWTLYQARTEWLQRNRLLDSARQLHEVLKGRESVDSTPRQILRAEAAVASRRSDLIRIETRIRNAQSRIRTLTGDPRLRGSTPDELIPTEMPLAVPVTLSQRDATITALDNRPDIAESIRKIQATTARVGAAKNQVLPRLDMILHSHVAGLDAGRDPFNAFVNQFADGGPSYAAGLLYEVPVGNRAAQARLARDRWEMTRAMLNFQQTTEQTFTDVEVAIRECQTSLAEMVAKKQSIDAATREVVYLEQRWTLMPDPNDSAVRLIEDLLDAQERLADEERAFVLSQVGYAMSWVELRKSMGVLLRLDDAYAQTEATGASTTESGNDSVQPQENVVSP